MPTEQLIDKLNEILKWEWKGVSQYSQYGFVVTGTWREVYAEKFKESAEESFEHAQKIGEKISAFGFVPTVERAPVKQTGMLEEMLTNSLEFEQTAVDIYSEALAMADGVDRPLVVLLEEILLQEQEGVDDLTLILKEHSAASEELENATSKAG